MIQDPVYHTRESPGVGYTFGIHDLTIPSIFIVG